MALSGKILGVGLTLLILLAGCKEPTEPDTQPPQVELVYPVDGSDVFGMVEIRVVAEDTSGISKVQFYIDGDLAPDGVDRSYPYVYLWDTTVLPESTTHTISAIAWDEPENSRASDTISVTVLLPLTYAIVSTYGTPVYASNLWIEGGRAYIADRGGGLQIVDISDPANPFLVGTWDSLKYVRDVYVQDQYAYLAEEEEGLLVLDVSAPANPAFVGSCELSNGGRAISVLGNCACMADVEQNLQVFDTSNPESIAVRTFRLGAQAYDVWMEANLAFVVVEGEIGLKVVELGGAFPRTIGELATPNHTAGIYLEAGYGYLADGGYGGLQVADLSNPSAPRIVGSCATFGYAYSPFVSGRYAYVADGPGGLVVVDLINRTYPSRVAHIDTPGFARSVVVSGEYAYIADGSNGMVIVGWSR